MASDSAPPAVSSVVRSPCARIGAPGASLVYTIRALRANGSFHSGTGPSQRRQPLTNQSATFHVEPPTGEPPTTLPIFGAWSSTVSDLQKFEVLISSDRGAHLFSVGETQESRFSYAIPVEYEGFLTVQVVAHRHSGAPLRSALDERSTFRVQAGDSAIR